MLTTNEPAASWQYFGRRGRDRRRETSTEVTRPSIVEDPCDGQELEQRCSTTDEVMWMVHGAGKPSGSALITNARFAAQFGEPGVGGSGRKPSALDKPEVKKAVQDIMEGSSSLQEAVGEIRLLVCRDGAIRVQQTRRHIAEAQASHASIAPQRVKLRSGLRQRERSECEGCC